MFPALPLLQIRGGRIEGPRAGHDPRREVPVLARRAGEVVLTDLDGLASGDPDLELLRDVARRSAVWADAGSRDAADVADLFVAGAQRVTVRWSLLQHPDDLDEIADLAEPGALYLGLEFRGAFVGNPSRRMSALDAPGVLDLAKRLALPVVALEFGDGEAGRKTVAAAEGERWYAAPRPLDALASLEADGWTGAIGLPPDDPTEVPVG